MESKINLAQVAPVNYKVTAALVNQFVVSTTQFLNRFVTRCDRKLYQVSAKMCRIQTTLTILEAKLSSISGIPSRPAAPAASPAHAPSAASPPDTSAAPQPSPAPSAVAQAPASQPQEQQPAAPPPAAAPEAAPKRHAVKDDVRYSMYFKMLKVGVPLVAVKGKMAAEGLDGNVMDMDPNAEAPPGGASVFDVVEEEASDQQSHKSEDEFSD